MNRKRRRVAIKQGRAWHGPSASVQAMFVEAIRHNGSGRPDDAERLLRQVLAVEPRHAGSLNLLGMIAYQGGRADLAFKLISAAVAINRRAAAAQSNLGNLLLAQGRFEEAAAARS
jgi:Flp pilus assembly protein TadD